MGGQENKLNPAALPVADAARLLSAVAGQAGTVEMLETDVTARAPQPEDGAAQPRHRRGSAGGAAIPFRAARRPAPPANQSPELGGRQPDEGGRRNAPGAPHAMPIRLSEEGVVVEAKRREPQHLTRISFVSRASNYFIGYFACQTFWAVVPIYAVTRGPADVGGWFFLTTGYSGAATVLSVLPGRGPSGAYSVDPGRHGCKNCGT